MIALLSWQLIAASVAAASTEQVEVLLLEGKANGARYGYVCELSTGRCSEGALFNGTTLQPTSGLSVARRNLMLNGDVLTAADDLLAHGRLGRRTVVVIRREKNSLLNPLHWLSALTGHPVQVSYLVLVLLEGDRVVAEEELLRGANSYRWSASLALPPPPP